MLPPSIRNKVILPGKWQEPEIGITIPEIDGLTDLLIVVRSIQFSPRGKKFDLSRSFKRIVTNESIELWHRKT